jgi:predicted protein tyrosine phosphatase
MIHVCSLARLHETVEQSGARHVVTLLSELHLVRRPPSIAIGNHLVLAVDDISMPLEGYTLAGDEHVNQLLGFVRDWDQRAPMVFHCFAGISRSTAGAFVTACALNPERDEADIARHLRRLSATATPNPRIVEIADRALGRAGRMCAAIDAIGRGTAAYEGNPFRLELG